MNPDLLRSDNFDAFMVDRQGKLARLIGCAIGHEAFLIPEEEGGEIVEVEVVLEEAEMTLVAD